MILVNNPGHRNQSNVRNALRIVGPTILVIGVGFVAVGLISFFSAFNSFDSPRYAWCSFVGMPLIFVGAVMSQFGYMGAVGRYVAGEVAPVAKDTVNYMAVESKEAIRHVSEAIGAGLSQSKAQATVVRCHKCNTDNQVSAKFCSSCGTALSKTKECGYCRELNDPDAKYCDNCGKSFIEG